jgi:hypothetical protein
MPYGYAIRRSMLQRKISATVYELPAHNRDKAIISFMPFFPHVSSLVIADLEYIVYSSIYCERIVRKYTA